MPVIFGENKVMVYNHKENACLFRVTRLSGYILEVIPLVSFAATKTIRKLCFGIDLPIFEAHS